MRKTKCLIFLVALLQSTSSLLLAQGDLTPAQSSSDAELSGVEYDSIPTQNLNTLGKPYNKPLERLSSTTASCISTAAVAENDHVITVGEYVIFLKSVAAKGDVHGLYSSAMEGQILWQLVGCRGEPFYYYYPTKQQEREPLLGLTLAEARRYCNWVENGRLFETATNKDALFSTETGSYFLDGDEVSINPEAKYHLVENEDEPLTFSITTETFELKNYPMMMFHPGEKENKSVTDNKYQHYYNRANEDSKGATPNTAATASRGDASKGIAENNHPLIKHTPDQLPFFKQYLFPPPWKRGAGI